MFTMSSVLDFPTWLPPGERESDQRQPCHKPSILMLPLRYDARCRSWPVGTKIPGGLVTPVSMQEPPPPPGQPKPEDVEPICVIM